MDELTYRTYEKWGEYFTGSQRKKPLFFFFAVIFFLLFFFRESLADFLNLQVEIETLNLVFTTLIQALLALVGLMGVVAIFKLQRIDAMEARILDLSMQNPHSLLVGTAFVRPEGLLRAVTDYLKDNTENVEDLHILRLNLDNTALSRRLVIEYAAKFTIYTFCLVLLALVFLIFTPEISSQKMGLSAVYLTVLLTAWSLFLAAKGFIQTLN